MQLLKPENKKNSLLPLFTIGTFGIHLLTLLLLMFHGTLLQQLRQQIIPQSLVQLVDGRAITVDPKNNLERNPQTIRRFVGEAMSLILTWSEKQSPETVWQVSSDLLADSLQPKFRKEMFYSSTTDQFENLNRGAEKLLIIQKISQPQKIEDGKWKVEILAHQVNFSNTDKLGKSQAFHKQIVVRAIDEKTVSLPNQPIPLHLAAYRLGEARLEISNVCEMQEKNCP